jgi:4-amino-4-deoxy-L-arabinose transferase-like glycosyltransferase
MWQDMLRAKNLAVGIFVVFILILGHRLRSYEYATVPHPGEVADEYGYGWSGLSLLTSGSPRSWTTLPAYKNSSFERINIDHIFTDDPHRPEFMMVTPWFDHPPTFGLITGGYSYMKGVRSFESMGAGIIRRPIVKIGIITTLMAFLLAYRMFDYRVGLLSALLYSIIPTVVISSRLAIFENIYNLFFPGAVLMAYVFLESRKRLNWLIAVGFVFLSILMKMWGVSSALALFFVAVYLGEKDRKFMIASLVAGTVLAFGAFAVFGSFYDMGLFWRVQLGNGGRFYGASSEVLFQAITGLRITTNKFLTDGWMLSMWIAFAALVFSKWKDDLSIKLISLAVLSHLLVMVLFGSESYGWYKYPMLPFLVIALSKVLVEIFDNPNYLMALVLLSLPLGTSVHRLIGVVNFQNYVVPLRLFAIFLIGTVALLGANKKLGSGVYKLLFVAVLVFAVWISIKDIYGLTYDKWFFVT